MRTTNNDKGSLKVGLSAGGKVWAIGDKLAIDGEGAKVRTVTFVMGKGEKTHLCFKGQGEVPMGEVEFELIGDVATTEAA